MSARKERAMSEERKQHEVDMLRRAAEAARNIQSQATGKRDWFDWVPEHLDRLADRMEVGA